MTTQLSFNNPPCVCDDSDDAVMVPCDSRTMTRTASNTFEVITLKLMEYLYPWILCGHTPLYLLNRNSWIDWSRYLSTLFDRRQFSPRRLINPLFDDRFLLSNRGPQSIVGYGATGATQNGQESVLNRQFVCEVVPSDTSPGGGSGMSCGDDGGEEEATTARIMEAYNESMLLKQHMSYLKDIGRRFISECFLHSQLFSVPSSDILCASHISTSTTSVPQTSAISISQRILLIRNILHTFKNERQLYFMLPRFFIQLLTDDVIPQLLTKCSIHTFYNEIQSFQQLLERQRQRQQSLDSELNGESPSSLLLQEQAQRIALFISNIYKQYRFVADNLMDGFSVIADCAGENDDIFKKVDDVCTSIYERRKFYGIDDSAVNDIFYQHVVKASLHSRPSVADDSKVFQEKNDKHMKTLVHALHIFLVSATLNEVDDRLLEYILSFSCDFASISHVGKSLMELARCLQKDKWLLDFPTLTVSPNINNDDHEPVILVMAGNKTMSFSQSDAIVKDSPFLKTSLDLLSRRRRRRSCCSQQLALFVECVPSSLEIFLEEYQRNPMNVSLLKTIKQQGHIRAKKPTEIAAKEAWDSNDLYNLVQPWYADFAMSLNVKETMQSIRVSKSIGLLPLQDLLTARIALLIKSKTTPEIQSNLGIPESNEANTLIETDQDQSWMDEL